MKILKKIKWISLSFSFGFALVFLVFSPGRAEAKESAFVGNADLHSLRLEIIHENQKWTFEPLKILDAVNFEKKTMIRIKNTDIYFPLVLDDENVETAWNAFEILTTTEARINKPKIHDYLEEKIIKKIEKPSSDVKIYRNSVKKDEKIIVEGKGQDGLKVKKDDFVAVLNLAINRPNPTRIVVPTMVLHAKIDISADLQELGIKELVATGHSAFAGSPKGRLHNIRTGIQRYNGLLVKPGEIFSFNKHLGPVDKEHDFLEELVIKPEGTIPEYGGGLCQISSTLYRAALFGGFPIVERAPHSYAVSYYAQVGGYGLDATVYPGARDVKFLNDSPAYLLIQAYTDGDHAYYKFYGTPDDRAIRLQGPSIANRRSPGPAQIIETDKLRSGVKKQVEKKHNGFDVTWYRYVVKDGVEKKERIFSNYKAIPEKILVGKMPN